LVTAICMLTSSLRDPAFGSAFHEPSEPSALAAAPPELDVDATRDPVGVAQSAPPTRRTTTSTRANTLSLGSGYLQNVRISDCFVFSTLRKKGRTVPFGQREPKIGALGWGTCKVVDKQPVELGRITREPARLGFCGQDALMSPISGGKKPNMLAVWVEYLAVVHCPV
jgi:hypothetical protein